MKDPEQNEDMCISEFNLTFRILKSSEMAHFSELMDSPDVEPFLPKMSKPSDEGSIFDMIGNDFWSEFSDNFKMDWVLTDPMLDTPVHPLEDLSDFSNTEDEEEYIPPVAKDCMWNAGNKARLESLSELDSRFSLNPVISAPYDFSDSLSDRTKDVPVLDGEETWITDISLLNGSRSLDSTEAEDSSTDEEIDVITVHQPTVEEQAPRTDKIVDTADKEVIKRGVKRRLRSRSVDKNKNICRSTHNDLERKRRDELRTLFDDLKNCFPEITKEQRTSKVSILNKAVDNIGFLVKEEKHLLSRKAAEKKRHEILLKRVSELSALKNVEHL